MSRPRRDTTDDEVLWVPAWSLPDGVAPRDADQRRAEDVGPPTPWRGLDDLEIATVEYIGWYNNRRLHGELGHIPPAEYEALHAMTHPVTATLETD